MNVITAKFFSQTMKKRISINSFSTNRVNFQNVPKISMLNSFSYNNKRTFQSTVENSVENKNSEEYTHFGFKSVKKEDKESLVKEVFHNVAEKYDLMNDLMSMGLHRLWKDELINTLAPPASTKLLDVAGGTGDIAFRFLDYVKQKRTEEVFFSNGSSKESNQSTNNPAEVIVYDINANMLRVGRERYEKKIVQEPPLNNPLFLRPSPIISWVEGDAEKLPFEDNQFDAYTIAFGIRNCTNIDVVLTEAFRVLKKGGRFLCLEFSHVENPILSQVYDLYSFNVIPPVGMVVAGDWNSYEYLVESIRKFPKQRNFAKMIEDAGFSNVAYKNLTFGTVAIHSGFKF